MKRGTGVTLRLADGELVKGQVWDDADEHSVWVALESGFYAKVSVKSGAAHDERGVWIGRVA